MSLRKVASASAVAVIVAGAMALGVAAPAGAATAYPDGWSPKSFMINVTSSILAALGSTPAKRALVANAQKYDHSWEGLEQQMKLKTAAGTPMTPADYTLAKQEYFYENGITSKQGDLTGKKAPQQLSAPATALKKLGGVQVPGGVAVTAGIAAGYFGFQVGKGVAGMMGMSESSLCEPVGFSDPFGIIAKITDTDCAAVLAQENGFPINQDASASMVSTAACAPDGNCVQLVGSVKWQDPTNGAMTIYCIATKGFVNQYQARTLNAAGGIIQGQTANPGITSFGTSDSSQNPGTVARSCWDAGLRAPAGWNATLFEAKWAHPDGILKGLGWTKLTTPTVVTAPSGPFLGGDPDPSRTLQCSVLGTNGVTYTASTPAFKQSTGTTPPPNCDVDLPDGVTAANVKVDQVTPSSPSLPSTPLYNEPTTQAYQDWYSAYPECRDGACSLDLIDKRGTTPVSCFDSTTSSLACADWMLDQNKATDYQCTYGAHDVDISECFAYGDVFKPEKVIGGQAYADPATGESVSGQSSPNAAQQSLGRDITDPRDYTGCLAKGWAAANPVEWVLIPAQCALQWGFAPRAAVVQSAVDQVSHSWSATPFAQVGPIATNFSHIPVLTGCSGMNIDQPVPWPQPWRLKLVFGNACDDPLKTAAGVMNGILSALVYAGGALAFIWYIARALGYDGFGRRS